MQSSADEREVSRRECKVVVVAVVAVIDTKG